MGCAGQKIDKKNEENQYDLTIENYFLKKQSKIARGAFSTIWKCRDVKTGTLYALKEMKLRDNSAIQAFQKQIRLLKLTKEAHLHGQIEMLASSQQKDSKMGRVGRILEELGSQTLIDQINQQSFTEKQVTYIAHQIAEDLMELHGLGVYHLDVKPDNVLLVGKRYKLCDFGSVRTKKFVFDDLNEEQKIDLTEFIEDHTTLHYRAPELIDSKGQQIGSQADIWMLGCCIYMVAFGRHPFEEKDPVKIVNCEVKYPNEGYFTDLCRRIFVREPKKRPTAGEIVDMLTIKLDSQ